MLASIHPLGEWGRSQSFTVTVVAYTVASIGAAAAFGAALALLGALVVGGVDETVRLAVVAALAVGAAAVDRRERRIPSWHRQVNEDWLADYRGWVYGAGFGAQLGLGVVTIVTTASVYVLWAGAFLAADPPVGAVLGAVFGLARALPVVGSVRVRTPAAVASRVRDFDRRDGRFRAVTVSVELAVAAVLVGAVLV